MFSWIKITCVTSVTPHEHARKTWCLQRPGILKTQWTRCTSVVLCVWHHYLPCCWECAAVQMFGRSPHLRAFTVMNVMNEPSRRETKGAGYSKSLFLFVFEESAYWANASDSCKVNKSILKKKKNILGIFTEQVVMAVEWSRLQYGNWAPQGVSNRRSPSSSLGSFTVNVRAMLLAFTHQCPQRLSQPYCMEQ